MTVNDIIRRVRMSPEVRDTNKAKYSDYDMIAAINEALTNIYNELSTFSNDLLTKSEVVEISSDGRGELPEDFLSVVEVYQNSTVYLPESKGRNISPFTYSIVGEYIYARAKRLTLDYKPSAPELTVEDMEEDLELPSFLGELLKRLVIRALSGTLETPEGLDYMRHELRAIIANRGFNRLEMKGAWSEEL